MNHTVLIGLESLSVYENSSAMTVATSEDSVQKYVFTVSDWISLISRRQRDMEGIVSGWESKYMCLKRAHGVFWNFQGLGCAVVVEWASMLFPDDIGDRKCHRMWSVKHNKETQLELEYIAWGNDLISIFNNCG